MVYSFNSDGAHSRLHKIYIEFQKPSLEIRVKCACERRETGKESEGFPGETRFLKNKRPRARFPAVF